MVSQTTDNERVLYDEPIIQLFSKPSIVRILTVLSDAAGMALTPSDIVEQADVTKASVYNNIELLAQLGLVEVTKRDGSKSLRMDLSDDAPQAFVALRDEMIDQNA